MASPKNFFDQFDDPTLQERGAQAGIEQKGASAAASAAGAAKTTALLPYQVKEAQRKEAAAAKAEQDARDRAAREASAFRSDAELALGAINKLRSILGPTSAGYGAALKDLPESRAKEVSSIIKQLQSNKFFIQIAEMKQQSGKGQTGMGRILQSEIPMFVNKWGTLDQARDTRDLGESLNVMENQIRRMYARVSGADIDNPDPKVAYSVQQQYGIRPQGSALEQAVTPPAFKAETLTGALKPGQTEKAGSIPEPMQREYEEYVSPRLGQLNPDEYAKFRAEQAVKYGFADTPEARDTYKAEAERLNAAAARNAPLNLQIAAPNVPAAEGEKARAEALANPVTGRLMSAAVGAANQFTSELFPSVMAAATGKSDEEMRRTAGAYEGAYPGASALGRIAGGVGQVAVAPELFAKYGIPLMTAEGAIGGAATNPEDRVAGAARGAGINLALAGAGTGVSALARGAKGALSPLATRYGIPLTTGELLQSPTLRYVEQKLSGVPGIGAGIKRRMEAANLGTNQAAFEDALSDIGGRSTSTIGPEGLSDAYSDVGNAYDAALRGVRVPVTPEFRKSVYDAIEGAGQIDSKYADLLDKELSPFLKKRTLSGPDVQQILQRSRNVSSVAKDDNGSAWKNYVLPHIQTIEGLTTDAVGNVAPAAAEGLTAANNAYRKVSILADAVSNHLDEGGIFTPQTLLKSVQNNVEAFEGTPTLARGQKGGRKLPLLDLARESADVNKGLLQPGSAPSVAGGAALAGLGTLEAGIEGALAPDDNRHSKLADFGSAAARNALLLGAAAAAPRAMYAGPTQEFLQRAMTRGVVPQSRAADLLAKYLPAGLTALPARQYSPPVSVGERDMPVAQLPRVMPERVPSDIGQLLAPRTNILTLADGTEIDLSKLDEQNAGE